MKKNLTYKDPLVKYKKGDKFNIDFTGVKGFKDKVDEATKSMEKFRLATEMYTYKLILKAIKEKLIEDLLGECEEKIEEKPKRDPRKRKLVIRKRRNI